MRFETPPELRVLVADDDAEMRALVAESLRADGYDVVEATDGADLLARLEEMMNEDDRAKRALVVVTDVLMPNLSGLGVLAILRKAGHDVPVILMTGLTDDSVPVVAKRFGAVALFRKPVDIDNLRTAVVNARTVFGNRFVNEAKAKTRP
jgi:two-component system response regulator (stage 0 sporulation protein F)